MIVYVVYMKIYGSNAARPTLVYSIHATEAGAEAEAKSLGGSYRVMKWQVQE